MSLWTLANINLQTAAEGDEYLSRKMLTVSRICERWQTSVCKRPQRGEHLSRNMLTFSRVYEHWQESICKRLQRCEHLSKNMLTFSRVFEDDIDFLRYCWTEFSFYMCFTMFSEALRTPRTHGDTIKGFRAQPPGKPVRMRIKTAAEVQTFVKKYVNFLTSFCTLAKFNLQTAAAVHTFVK